MHHDPINRKREQKELNVGDLVRHAVELLWQEPDADPKWRQGITELVAKVGYRNVYEEADRAIKDCAEEMESDIASEIERAESDLERAAKRLTDAKAKRKGNDG